MEVLFDREDRVYRFGDEITGRVVMAAKRELGFRDLKLRCMWRTHGQGDRDQDSSGPEVMLVRGRRELPVGEALSFPFRIPAPRGPVTYHGHEVNVDWYVAASARSDFGLPLKCEEDFLLQGGETAGPVVLGNRQVDLSTLPPGPRELPVHSGFQEWSVASTPPQPKRSDNHWPTGIALILSILGIIGLGAWGVFFPGQDLPWVLVLGAVAVGGLAVVLVRQGYRAKLQDVDLCVEPEIACPGDHVICRAHFRIRNDVYLRSITASVYARESVTFTQGTATSTRRHEVSRDARIKTFNEQMSAGRSVSYECALPLPENAPATFGSRNNALEWFVELRVEFQGWAGMTKSLPFTVLPAGVMQPASYPRTHPAQLPRPS